MGKNRVNLICLKHIFKLSYPIIYVPFLNVNGMVLFPFILINKPAYRNDSQIIRHETIHLQQQLELLILPFYILYAANYIINLWRYKNSYQAYYHIIFEREAYANDGDILYLRKRTLWAFLKYIHANKSV